MLENTSPDTIQFSDYTLMVDENDEGDLMLNLPEDLIQQLGWKENDELEWILEEGDDFLILRKVEEDGDV